MLDDERMTEQKLWGYQYGDDDPSSGNTFGRKVLKEGTMENKLILPFKSYPLFANPYKWAGGATNQVNGLLRSGRLTGAAIKCSINVSEVDESEDGEEEEKKEETTKGQTKKDPTDLELDLPKKKVLG